MLKTVDDRVSIGYRPPNSAGLWLLDTANANCWDTPKRQIINRTAADVTLLQETKLRAEKCAAATAGAARKGWRAHQGPALTTAKHGVGWLSVPAKDLA